jgi:sulfite reductase (ferredoxin)
VQEIVEHLERVFGEAAASLRLNLDGCPHACAHHWIGDIGLQGTTLRERGSQGERLQGYDLFLRGGLARDAAIGRPVLKRVSATEVHLVIENLVRAWIQERQGDESVQNFFNRLADDEILAISERKVEQYA